VLRASLKPFNGRSLDTLEARPWRTAMVSAFPWVCWRKNWRRSST